jgi:chromosomal replication initiation ATPase DnaA
MGAINWNQCLSALEAELPLQQFNTWVRPLHAIELPNGLKLLAPNRFVVDWVKANLLPRITKLLSAEAAANAQEFTSKWARERIRPPHPSRYPSSLRVLAARLVSWSARAYNQIISFNRS